MALASKEILDAQTHVWNLIYSYINSMSLKCAIQLGIPDAINDHGEPITLSRLAAAVAIDDGPKIDALRRLMRVLVHSKFFDLVKVNAEFNDADVDEAYGLTVASRLLLRRGAPSMVPFALLALDPITMDPWHCMSEWFRDERSSSFETKHGDTFWEHAARGGDGLNALFNEGMASDSGFLTSVLCRDAGHVFEGLGTMVDVGGGTGTTARALAAAFPELKCVVLDLPHVVDGLEGLGNLRFVGGNMFESIPCANAVFLKWILHDWSDEDCVKILEKCKEAINADGGKVILVEVVVEDRKEEYEATKTQLFFDVQMMALINGKERNEKEWAKLFSAAGFGNYRITPILGLRSVIEVFP